MDIIGNVGPRTGKSKFPSPQWSSGATHDTPAKTNETHTQSTNSHTCTASYTYNANQGNPTARQTRPQSKEAKQTWITRCAHGACTDVTCVIGLGMDPADTHTHTQRQARTIRRDRTSGEPAATQTRTYTNAILHKCKQLI